MIKRIIAAGILSILISSNVFAEFAIYTIDKKFEAGKPLVSYTPESVTMAQSEEYRYERKTVSRRV